MRPLATFGNAIRENIGDASAAGDAGTADLNTEVSLGMDQWVCFVEAHPQADA